MSRYLVTIQRDDGSEIVHETASGYALLWEDGAGRIQSSANLSPSALAMLAARVASAVPLDKLGAVLAAFGAFNAGRKTSPVPPVARVAEVGAG